MRQNVYQVDKVDKMEGTAQIKSSPLHFQFSARDMPRMKSNINTNMIAGINT